MSQRHMREESAFVGDIGFEVSFIDDALRKDERIFVFDLQYAKKFSRKFHPPSDRLPRVDGVPHDARLVRLELRLLSAFLEEF